MKNITKQTIEELFNKISLRWKFKSSDEASLYLNDMKSLLEDCNFKFIDKVWTSIIRRETNAKFRPQPIEIKKLVEEDINNEGSNVPLRYTEADYAWWYNSSMQVPDYLNKYRYSVRCELMRSDIGQQALEEGWGYSLWWDSEKPGFDFDDINIGIYRDHHKKAIGIYENTQDEAVIAMWGLMQIEGDEIKKKFLR